jgi:hypothetical protein
MEARNARFVLQHAVFRATGLCSLVLSSIKMEAAGSSSMFTWHLPDLTGSHPRQSEYYSKSQTVV